MDYKCYLCRCDFKDARLLSCYHSFCRVCLDNYLVAYYEEGNFKCPLCRECNHAPVNGARGLPKNKFLYIPAGTAYCSECEIKTKARGVCRDCDKNFCRACLVNHEHKRRCKFHTVFDLDDDAIDIKALHCSNHKKQKLLFYCDVCEEPICGICNTTTHKFHRATDITSKHALLKDELARSLNDLVVNSKIEEIKSTVNEQKRKMKVHQEDMIAAVDERANELHKLINEIRDGLIRQIVHEQEQNMEKLKNNVKQTDKNVNAVDELKKFTSLFLNRARQNDIMMHAKKIQRQIRKLTKSEVKVSEIRHSHFRPSLIKEADAEIRELLFGKFESQVKRPKEIQSILRLDNLRRSNSDEGRSASDPLNFEKNGITNRSLQTDVEKRGKLVLACSKGTVTGLTVLSNGTICACLGVEGILEIFSCYSGRRKNRIRFPHMIDDVAGRSSNVIFVSSNALKKIYKVVNDKKEVFVESPMCVRGIALADQGNLLACMTSKASYLESHQSGCIREITRALVLTNEINDQRIKHPSRIAIGHNGCIVVSDWVQLGVFICKDFRVVGSYFGCQETEREFVPRGLCCLSTGGIVVLNFSANTLHFLTPDGQLKRIVPLSEPDCCSLTNDFDDTLWVGTQNGKVFPFELR